MKATFETCFLQLSLLESETANLDGQKFQSAKRTQLQLRFTYYNHTLVDFMQLYRKRPLIHSQFSKTRNRTSTKILYKPSINNTVEKLISTHQPSVVRVVSSYRKSHQIILSIDCHRGSIQIEAEQNREGEVTILLFGFYGTRADDTSGRGLSTYTLVVDYSLPCGHLGRLNRTIHVAIH